MSQKKYWEEEYSSPKFLSLYEEPQRMVINFFKWLRRDMGMNLEGKRLLDAGCGIGRNLIWGIKNFPGLKGRGFDMSEIAIEKAKELARKNFLPEDIFYVGNITEMREENSSADIILAINVASSLNPPERSRFISELSRVASPGAYVLVNEITLDGDRNAKNLIKKFPGIDNDSYIVPDTMLMEWVYDSRKIEQDYSGDFSIEFSKKFTGYQRYSKGINYKRRYLTLYLKKK